PPLEQKELMQGLEALERDLRGGETTLDALGKMEEALRELREQQERWAGEERRMDRWAEQWDASHPLLGEAMKQAAAQDADGLNEALDALSGEAASLSPEQKEALAQALEQLAASADAFDEETAQQLQEALEQLASGL